MSDWCVVRTNPQAERWARQNLTRQGYETYLPLCLIRRRDRIIRSHWHIVEVPLFSGYLFVSLAHGDPWTPIRYTPGVYRLLADRAGNPQYVRAGAVEAVQAAVAVRATQPPDGTVWRPGDASRLVYGPFAGHDAVVLSVTGDTALVSLLVFGHPRNTRVQIDALGSRDE